MKNSNAFLARLRESVASTLLIAFILTTAAISPVGAQSKKAALRLVTKTPAKVVTTPPTGAPIWDQSQFDLNNGWMISNQVVGENFELVSPRRVTSTSIWLADDAINDNGVLDSFSGTMGVAIYSDNSNLPATLLYSYTITPTLVDTGLQSGSGNDVFRADLQFPAALNLVAGNYWIAFHEGPWSSGDDLTPVYVLSTNSPFGTYTTAAFPTAPPSGWQSLYGGTDIAFMLNGDSAWNQTSTIGQQGFDITNQSLADDFVLSSTTTLTGFTAILSDDVINDNGALDSFSGTLGWAIYSDAPNAVGAPLATGTATPLLVDTGLQTSGGTDMVRAEVSFTSNVVLPAGTYWLGLREGADGSMPDGSNVYWAFTSGVNGQMPQFILFPPTPNFANFGMPDVAWGLWSLAPTAANVSVGGRVVNQSGFGVANAVVTMTRTNGAVATARTNSFGYFTFRDVVVGEDYILGASAKRLRFDPQLVSVADTITDITLVGR